MIKLCCQKLERDKLVYFCLTDGDNGCVSWLAPFSLSVCRAWPDSGPEVYYRENGFIAPIAAAAARSGTIEAYFTGIYFTGYIVNDPLWLKTN